MSYVNFLIQLTEKDKRLLVALFIALIIIFVLIAYIGQGIKALMKRYSKGIDGYMHELCSAKLVTTPKQFRAQVFKKESKVLYASTRWVFRVFIVFTTAFIVYTCVAKPSGDGSNLFKYFNDSVKGLFIQLKWPRGEFFGIKNFPVDWPYVARGVEIKFTLPCIVSYLTFIAWVFTFFGLFTSTLRFIARVNRAKVKSVEVFSRSLDNAVFVED